MTILTHPAIESSLNWKRNPFIDTWKKLGLPMPDPKTGKCGIFAYVPKDWQPKTRLVLPKLEIVKKVLTPNSFLTYVMVVGTKEIVPAILPELPLKQVRPHSKPTQLYRHQDYDIPKPPKPKPLLYQLKVSIVAHRLNWLGQYSIFHNGKTYHFRKAGTIIQAFNIQRVRFDFLLTDELVTDAIREAKSRPRVA